MTSNEAQLILNVENACCHNTTDFSTSASVRIAAFESGVLSVAFILIITRVVVPEIISMQDTFF